ncbi:protein SCO1/2 [Sphingomonas gellani]|uniref:Protein SCO1/2 n=1 Tax=Sphingomonas gellani TaxID=1166340 RepID=A0A1H7ZFX0_9SPHN|nr:SCO family protein [Sphingomonas gellani]SEM57216.1 protein SCO1/2 [Sphingomonas gellani]
MIRAVLCSLLIASPAAAELSPRQLAGAVARPVAGAMLPARLPFTNQHGTVTTLGRVAGGVPLVLVFADYTCRHVCAPGLTMTATALSATGLRPGRDYRLAVIGIDPNDTLADARRMSGVLRAYPKLARGTALLTGTPAAIGAATRALGYGYVRDAATDQFAHEAAAYVFGRDGKLVALLPELGGDAAPLLTAIKGQARDSDSWAGQVARLCYGLDGAHGRYGRIVTIALQLLSGALLAGVLAMAWRRRHAR